MAINLTKELAKKELLVPHLNNWFAQASFPDTIPLHINPNKQKDDAFHPSSALGCPREIYAKRMEHLPPEKFDAEMRKVFMFGYYAHALLQWAIVEGLGFATWDEIEREFYFKGLETEGGNTYDVRGFTDVARCQIPGHDEPILVDIKTASGASFRYGVGAKLWQKYIAQVRLYLDFIGISRGILLIVEKDTPHNFKEHVVHADPAAVDEMVSCWEYVVDCQARDVVPDCWCEPLNDCPVRGLYL